MIGLGSIVNAAAIVAGGCVGLVAGRAISERTASVACGGHRVDARERRIVSPTRKET